MAVPTILLHLSDIHFRYRRSGTACDIDKDIRDQLERDVAQLRARLGDAIGVIVTGDIAFGGKKEEYQIASEWLQKLCDIVGCPQESVWTVPGNHDIDREVIQKSNLLQVAQSNLRAGSGRLDDRLRALLYEDPESATLLFRPLQNYNEFALRFGCDVSAQSLVWTDELPLLDGLILRLYGATSPLVSNATDDEGTNRLLLGLVQSTLPQEDGVENVFLCHHPPEWLLDRDEVDARLRARARLQLFGHKHSPSAYRLADGVRLNAGAMHPDRGEVPWAPTYNVLAIGVEDSPGGRQLVVDLYERVWAERDLCFCASPSSDTEGCHKFKLPLPQRLSPQPTAAVAVLAVAPDPPSTAPAAKSEKCPVNPARTLTYRFLTLSYVDQLDIAQRLSLIREEDAQLAKPELHHQYFVRAKEARSLEKLWAEVSKRHGLSQEQNPFVGE